MSRKKKIEEKPAPEPEVRSTGRAEAPAAPPQQVGFPAWLDTMTCTRPFTIDDCNELHDMLKRDMPTFMIDVIFDDKHVHVYAYASRESMKPTCTRSLELK